MKIIKEVREYALAFITIALAMDHFGWFDRFNELAPVSGDMVPAAESLSFTFVDLPDLGPDPVVVISALIGATIAVGWVVKQTISAARE